MRAKIGPTSPVDGLLFLLFCGVVGGWGGGAGGSVLFFFIHTEPCLYDCWSVCFFVSVLVCLLLLYFTSFFPLFFPPSDSSFVLSLFIFMFILHV